MFDMGSMAKKFLTSPEGQQMITEFLSSPEGKRVMMDMVATPEGKRMAGGLLLSLLDQLAVPDETKGILRQVLQTL